VYYPVYVPPLIVAGPTYVSYPTFVTSETIIVSEPRVIEREVIVERPIEVEREVFVERPVEVEREAAEVVEETGEPEVGPIPEGSAPLPRIREESVTPQRPVDVGPSAVEQGAAPTNAPSLPVGQLQQMMLDGTRLFGEGQYEEAAGLFTKTAEADPNNVDAVLALAVARFATGHYGQSAGLIRRGTEMFPEVVDTVFDLRDRYGKIEDFEQHVQGLELWVQDHPEDLDAHVVLGFVYHFTGQRPWAAEVFNYVKDASPADAPVADVFLNAKPLEDSGATDGTSQTDSPSGTGASPSTDAPPSAAPAAPPGMAPKSPAASKTGMASSALLAPRPLVSAAPVYQGRLSQDQHVGPQERTTVDGIVVKLKKTQSNPPRADLELRVGKFKEPYDQAPVGKRIIVFGESDAMYVLEVTAVDPKGKTLTFTVQEAPRREKVKA
jgi:tetratricopeptide (TPR) repeat protein